MLYWIITTIKSHLKLLCTYQRPKHKTKFSLHNCNWHWLNKPIYIRLRLSMAIQIIHWHELLRSNCLAMFQQTLPNKLINSVLNCPSFKLLILLNLWERSNSDTRVDFKNLKLLDLKWIPTNMVVFFVLGIETNLI